MDGARTCARAAARTGIDPERLVFAPRQAATGTCARPGRPICSSTRFPTTPHTTASDALWAGLPLLTCAGDTFAARVAGSLLRAAGLPSWSAASLEDYENSASAWRSNRRSSQAARAACAARERLPLFDTPRFVRDLENAYEEMWRIHASGAAARLIEV